MTNITYGIIEEKYIFNNMSRTAYGIAAFEDLESNGTASIVVQLHDITDNKEQLLELVQSCNCLELSTIHLHDVVEDFLSN